jgi:haloacetate dehalogenase
MYEGFRRFDIATSDPGVAIRGVVGGSGPPLLLLHGNPLTHIHWRLVAPRLAHDFTVVATDLRGYGDSGKPRGLPDHSNYSFRRMAQDQVEVMRELGFERFRVAGHDRGARTAYRMALDHPEKVLTLAEIDILPTRPRTSTACARTTGLAPPSTSRWTPRASRPGGGSRARFW